MSDHLTKEKVCCARTQTNVSTKNSDVSMPDLTSLQSLAGLEDATRSRISLDNSLNPQYSDQNAGRKTLYRVVNGDPCRECKICDVDHINELNVYQKVSNGKFYVLLNSGCDGCTTMAEVVAENQE